MAEALISMDGFKYGADPELFIMNDLTGEYVCPDGIIPGTKAEPYKVHKGAVQQDGMAAEFNIEPATTFKEFDNNIRSVLSQLQGFLPEHHRLVALPAVTFSEKVWEKASDGAKELGCSPDLNAWTKELNPPPECLEEPRLRTASGHLHIGWTEDESIGDETHMGHATDLVKQLDYYLGGWSIQQDADKTRRKLYGKAGACRIKPYGVEYRVLSNFWVMAPRNRLVVWNRMVAAINAMQTSCYPDQLGARRSGHGGFTFNELLIQSIDTSTRNSVLEDVFFKPILSFN